MRSRKRVKKEKSIRVKLVTVIFLACLVLLTAVGVLITNTVRTEYEITNHELLLEKVTRVSGEADAYLKRYTTVAETVAANKTIHDYLVSTQTGVSVTTNKNYEAVLEILRNTQKPFSDVVSSIYVVEDNPSSYITSSKTIVNEDVDVTKKVYYKTIQDGLIHISEPYVALNTGNMTVALSAPVTVNNQIVGEVCIDIEIVDLEKITGDNKFGETGFFTLLTGDNNIAYSKDKDKILKNVTEVGFDERLLTAIKEKNTEAIEYEVDGEKCIGIVNEIGDTGWKLIVSISDDEFSAAVEKLSMGIVRNFLIVGILLLILIFIMITKMTKPIKDIQEVADKLAKGDLDVEINVSSNDEIGKLAQSISSLTDRLKKYINYIDESSEVLNHFANGDLRINLKYEYTGEFEKLKDALVNVSETQKHIISDLKESSDSINSSASQIATGATVTSQGATEQASAIEELSAEINEMYMAVNNTADRAKEAGDKSAKSSCEVTNGNEKMNELLIAMNEISNSSSQIGKIIKVIDDIAFQTNILALNAAVEAARAGSAGKGFAVVADEVRNLAGKSAEAAKQTTDLIENSIIAINKGTTLADEAGKSLMGIVSTTDEASSIIAEIARMAEEQTVSINQIKTGVEQVSSVVQENAASAETSAANSEELAAQVEHLNEMISKFRLN
ncbi:methyl-accepting chemotaxis protein [Sedimentibacter acidaminivorans]|uniref:Methyl-accepting chemotaxis protein n=1 Tax=Sedimentibacter acidaminivorans TaxID=913099 RepID=A0ABS4GA48_9FIRM|nr:methyl-accepting chemotaxis protein [Sedimentibacter acidaminivorans]MBP1924285.1 methyl-accepting chemotaxis protein [Sedimentibacter acidaminivorans]